MAICAWTYGGVQFETKSILIPGSNMAESIASCESNTSASDNPNFFRIASAFSGKISTKATMLHRPGNAKYPCTCAGAIFPHPMMATLIIL
jgi:hypothetical protein